MYKYRMHAPESGNGKMAIPALWAPNLLAATLEAPNKNV